MRPLTMANSWLFRICAQHSTSSILNHAFDLSGEVLRYCWRQRLTPAIKREMRRRAAVEPVIGHIRNEHRMPHIATAEKTLTPAEIRHSGVDRPSAIIRIVRITVQAGDRTNEDVEVRRRLLCVVKFFMNVYYYSGAFGGSLTGALGISDGKQAHGAGNRCIGRSKSKTGDVAGQHDPRISLGR